MRYRGLRCGKLEVRGVTSDDSEVWREQACLDVALLMMWACGDGSFSTCARESTPIILSIHHTAEKYILGVGYVPEDNPSRGAGARSAPA